jgi:integrase
MWNKIYDKINEVLGGNANFKATDITPYVFRHEYATVLYYSEVDVKDAARLMGHKDTRLILDVYAELDEGRSNSTEKIAKFLESSY